jgi:DNA-binding NarL/FixJ family response regulator
MTASNCDEAVKICANDREGATFAIVDLKMPGLDGPATIAALMKQSPRLKVISVSGQMLSPYFARLADLGVRYFLSKPFGVDDLMETIRELSAAA